MNTASADSSVAATMRSQRGILGTSRCAKATAQPSAAFGKSANPVAGCPGTASPSSASRIATSSLVK